MQHLRAAVLAALFLFTAMATAQANDVTLTARDGSVEITGNLLGFDGEFYRVDTEFGVLTIDGSGVNCTGPACPSLGTFVARFSISGARSMGEVLIPSLIEGFALNTGFALTREDLPGTGLIYTLYDRTGDRIAAEITIRLTTSEEGFVDLVGEEADMVLSLREVSPAERNLARDAGLGDLRSPRQNRVIALDGLVPIVAPGNPIRRVTMNQLAGIFAGRITRWSELGGEDAPITTYLEDADSDYARSFTTRVLAPFDMALSGDVLHQATGRGVAVAVTDDPFGIGITRFTQPGLAEVVTVGGPCGFEVVAGQSSIKSGDYPLTAPLYLYLPARRLPKLARDFLAYLRSDSAQMVTRRAGFVDQALTEVPLDAQGGRLANAIRAAGPEVGLDELHRMMALFTDKRRLTLSFRFKDGSTALDARSLSNASLLAAALEAGDFDGRNIVFAGFSDGQGEAGQNLALAKRRAEAVMSAVLNEAEAFDRTAVTLTADAFGEALPMACDDTAWGRRVNRRVEIWID